MRRDQLEHIIRAASAITNQADIVVVGNQSILGQFPHASAELLTSMEADIYPRYRPDMSIIIDGAIGEKSPFHETFGYYAHGVFESVATLPHGWEQRLVCIRNENTGGGTGWCLEVHDLAVSKLAAGREKDFDFVTILLHEKMILPSRTVQRIEELNVSSDLRSVIMARMVRMSGR